MAIKVVIITVIVFWKVIIMYLKLNEAPRTATLSPLVSLIVGDPSVYKTPKTKQPSDSSESCSRGPWCKEDLNRLMPWIDKIWALHPYFPELMDKERILQEAKLLK